MLDMGERQMVNRKEEVQLKLLQNSKVKANLKSLMHSSHKDWKISTPESREIWYLKLQAIVKNSSKSIKLE